MQNQCDHCGLTATVCLEGGFSWDFTTNTPNTLTTGLRLSSLNLRSTWSIHTGPGCSSHKSLQLDRIGLPGIRVSHVIDINPSMALKSSFGIDVSGGQLEASKLGVIVAQPAGVEARAGYDLISMQAYHSHLDDLASRLSTPAPAGSLAFNSSPSEVSFSGMIGPVFEISLSILNGKPALPPLLLHIPVGVAQPQPLKLTFHQGQPDATPLHSPSSRRSSKSRCRKARTRATTAEQAPQTTRCELTRGRVSTSMRDSMRRRTLGAAAAAAV